MLVALDPVRLYRKRGIKVIFALSKREEHRREHSLLLLFYQQNQVTFSTILLIAKGGNDYESRSYDFFH